MGGGRGPGVVGAAAHSRGVRFGQVTLEATSSAWIVAVSLSEHAAARRRVRPTSDPAAKAAPAAGAAPGLWTAPTG